MRDSATQIFHPYTDWEDWHAGMYSNQLRDEIAEQARSLLSDPATFGEVLTQVARRWPNSSAHNLSNVYRNHQPWCGRAAACFESGSSIRETNRAWWDMEPAQRLEANAVADRFTYEWRNAHLLGQTRMRI